MVVSILFVISFIYLLIASILVKKTDSKLNFGTFLLLDFILITFINALIVFVLGIFNIPAPLSLRSIIILLLAIYLSYILYKNKEYQKYNFSKINLLCILIILVFSIVLGFNRYGKNLDIVYETTDPAIHMLNSQRFAVSSNLYEDTTNIKNFIPKKSARTLFYGYVSAGTMMQVTDGFNKSASVRIKDFIIYDLFILFVIGVSSYYIMTYDNDDKGIKKLVKSLISVVIVFLLVYAYPYNSVLFGFHYLNIFVCISFLILLLFKLFDDELKNKIFIVTLSIFNFFIFSSYYMFVPVVYAAEGIYFLYRCFIKKDLDLKQMIKSVLITLIIPFVIGIFYYFISPKFSSSKVTGGVSAFTLEGYLYRNIISNIIILLPIFFYNIYYSIKNKKVSLHILLSVFSFLFLGMLFLSFYYGKTASYYFYKNYYLFSPLLFIEIGIAFNDKKRFDVSLPILFIFLATFVIYNNEYEFKVAKRNELLLNNNYSYPLMEIYAFNKLKTGDKPIYTMKQVDDLEDVVKNNKINQENFYYYNDELLKRFWIYDVTNLRYNPYNKSNYSDLMSKKKILKDNNIKYILVDKNTYKFNLKVLYENDSFILYSKGGK